MSVLTRNDNETMYDPATGDNWPVWIINTFLAIGAGMAAIIGVLTKLVDSKYRTEQAELKATNAADKIAFKIAMDEAKKEVIEARASMKAEFKESFCKLENMHQECEEDRRLLSNRVTVLEMKTREA